MQAARPCTIEPHAASCTLEPNSTSHTPRAMSLEPRAVCAGNGESCAVFTVVAVVVVDDPLAAVVIVVGVVVEVVVVVIVEVELRSLMRVDDATWMRNRCRRRRCRNRRSDTVNNEFSHHK